MYRGREGMWAWLLHRVTGLGVVLFLYVHIVDTWLVGFGPEVYDHVMGLYRNPFFRGLEVMLVGAVLYHGLNGLRVIAIDFLPRAAAAQRQLWYAVVVVTVVLFVPSAFIMIRAVLSHV